MNNCIELHQLMSSLNDSVYIRIMSGRKEVMDGYVREIQDLQGFQHFNVDCIEMLLSNTLLLKIREEVRITGSEAVSRLFG